MDKLVQQRVGEELDEVVAGIFDAMMDVSCVPMHAGAAERCEVCATIEFSGSLRGRCQLWMTREDAAACLCGMMGPAADPSGELPVDSVKELCNMVAGGWKSLQPPPPGCAAMSPPAPCAHDAAANEAHDDVVIRRQYGFGDHAFQVEMTLHLEEVPALFAA